MSQNNLNTMYGGGFARIMDNDKKVYRLVNVINARVMFESQTDSLRAVYPNSPSQVIATATTQLNCMITATLAEFNADQFALASNLVPDQPGEDASMPVINERHVCLSNKLTPNYLPKSGKPINVYTLRKGREFALSKVSGSQVRVLGSRVIKAGYLSNAEFVEGVEFALPVAQADLEYLRGKLGFEMQNGAAVFNQSVREEEIELLIKIGGVAGRYYPFVFKALPSNVVAPVAPSTEYKLRIMPKFNMSGVHNDISYKVYFLEQGPTPTVKEIGLLQSVVVSPTGSDTFVVDAAAAVSVPDLSQLLFVDSKLAAPQASDFSLAALSGKGIYLKSDAPGGGNVEVAVNANTLSTTEASSDISLFPVPSDNVQIAAEDNTFIYTSQFIYDASENGQGNGVVTISNAYVGQGVSLDYERTLASGSYWMIGGSSFKQMGYVDFYLTLQTQQGTWIFYRFPAAWPSGKYQLDMQGSFMNLPIEFTCVALPGYNLPYIVYGEIQK